MLRVPPYLGKEKKPFSSVKPFPNSEMCQRGTFAKAFSIDPFRSGLENSVLSKACGPNQLRRSVPIATVALNFFPKARSKSGLPKVLEKNWGRKARRAQIAIKRPIKIFLIGPSRVGI